MSNFDTRQRFPPTNGSQPIVNIAGWCGEHLTALSPPPTATAKNADG